MQQTDWKPIVAAFKKELDAHAGFSSVKDICDGLLLHEETSSYWAEKETSDVIQWLKDIVERTEADIRFRTKWDDIPNMQNILEYDYKEIGEIQKLITRLEAE